MIMVFRLRLLDQFGHVECQPFFVRQCQIDQQITGLEITSACLLHIIFQIAPRRITDFRHTGCEFILNRLCKLTGYFHTS